MKHFLLIPLVFCLLALFACTRDEHWNQRLTLVIDTPSGQITVSVVQRIDWQAAGFYTVAYQTQYGTVISSRGTDNLAVSGSGESGSDILNYWLAGAVRCSAPYGQSQGDFA